MDGIIIINKPKGKTSHDIVYQVKKIFNEKVGHTGTLDPNATGVLPLLIGKGTQCSQYLIEHDKEYEVELQLGKKTDTADIEGKIIEEREVDKEILQEETVKQVLLGFIGKQEQIPPIYSAIKVQGKKLYEYARQGKKVKIEPRKIEIYNCELLNIDNQDKEIRFRVHCSKGTYIRTLCEDIASNLKTVGYMKNLKRTKVGEFTINEAVNLEELQANIQDDCFMKKNFITIEKAFCKYKTIIIKEQRLKYFLNGVKLTYKVEDGNYRVYDENGQFIGIGVAKDELLKRQIII